VSDPLQCVRDDLEDAERALEAAFEAEIWAELWDAGDVAADAQEAIARAISLTRDARERL
jgi:hypothetical protein